MFYTFSLYKHLENTFLLNPSMIIKSTIPDIYYNVEKANNSRLDFNPHKKIEARRNDLSALELETLETLILF